MSTIPLVTDALVSRWQARPGLSGVQVFDGIPLDTEPEVVWIGEAVGTNADQPQQTPQQHLDEAYDLTIRVRVQWPIDDQKGCRDRVFAIRKELADDVSSDGTIGGVLSPYSGWASLRGAFSWVPDLTSEQRIGYLRLTIHVLVLELYP